MENKTYDRELQNKNGPSRLPKAVIFDMDGVLLDTESICDVTWKAAAEEMGLSGMEKALDSCRGTNRNDSMRILRGFYGKDFDAMAFISRTSEIFQKIASREGIKLMPYARECLEGLKGNFRLALASSTRGARVREELEHTGLIDFFETITTGDMVEHSKPDPLIYIKSANSLGLEPCDCMAVEDSPNGLLSAHRAGMMTVMIPDRIQPDEDIKKYAGWIFRNLQGLCAFLLSKN